MRKTATELLYLKPECADITQGTARVVSAEFLGHADSRIRERFPAQEVWRSVILDKTIFQPSACGQPSDTGALIPQFEIKKGLGNKKLEYLMITDVGLDKSHVVHVCGFPAQWFQKPSRHWTPIGEEMEMFVEPVRRRINQATHSSMHLIESIIGKLTCGSLVKVEKDVEISHPSRQDSMERITERIEKGTDSTFFGKRAAHRGSVTFKNHPQISQLSREIEGIIRGFIKHDVVPEVRKSTRGEVFRVVQFSGLAPFNCGAVHVSSARQIKGISIDSIKEHFFTEDHVKVPVTTVTFSVEPNFDYLKEKTVKK